MGAGTGPLAPGAKYDVTLTFNPQLLSTDDRYRDFRSGLEGLLERLPGGFEIKEVPQGTGRRFITDLKVTVTGPLDPAKNFNRAFNRLLWGVRHRLHSPPGTLNPGADSGVIVTASPATWEDEDT